MIIIAHSFKLVRIVNVQENYNRPFISFFGIAIPGARQNIALMPPKIESGKETLKLPFLLKHLNDLIRFF